MSNADVVKKLYKYVENNDTHLLMTEIIKLGYAGHELLSKLLAVHNIWKNKSVVHGIDSVHYDAYICELTSNNNGDNVSDITVLTKTRQIDILWTMFYISDDLKYPALVKKIANTITCPINMRSYASWSYKVHYENPKIYKTKQIPLLEE